MRKTRKQDKTSVNQSEGVPVYSGWNLRNRKVLKVE